MVDNIMKVASHPITTSLPALDTCDMTVSPSVINLDASTANWFGCCTTLPTKRLLGSSNKKTTRFLPTKRLLGPLNDVSTESYRASSSGTLAHLCANFGLASAQAAPFCTQVVGHSVRRSARAFVNGTGQSRLHT